jgi:glutaconate CoA-transferase, subunit B
MTAQTWSADEMMAVASARALAGAGTCFVGIGLPSEAANLARRTTNPDLVLIYESGTIGAKPSVLPLSIGDGELAETADAVVTVPEIFNYWLQGGRCDVGFLGAAQVDRFGNINTTLIRRADGQRDLRLPGAGDRRRLGLTGAGPTRVITDLCVLEPDPSTRELTLTACHPGVTAEQVRAATGWPLKAADTVVTTAAPSLAELAALRELRERTKEAQSARA